MKTHIHAFIGGAVLLSFPLFLFLLQLFDALLQDIGPEITLKIRQLLCTCQAIFSCLFKDVLGEERRRK